MKQLLFIAAIISVIACNQNSSKEISSQEKEIISKEVKSVADSMLKSFEKLSPEYFNFIDSTSFLWMNNEAIENYSEYKTETEAFYNTVAELKFDIKKEQFSVADANNVLWVFSGSIHAKGKDGNPIELNPFALSSHFQKINSNWKYVSGHESFPHQAPVNK
jgi:hypothetical protein